MQVVEQQVVKVHFVNADDYDDFFECGSLGFEPLQVVKLKVQVVKKQVEKVYVVGLQVVMAHLVNTADYDDFF